MSKLLPDRPENRSEIILYESEDGRTRLDVRTDGETVWLTQAQMAELFQTTPQNVTMHIQSLYAEGELAEAATCKDYLQVRRPVEWAGEQYDAFAERRRLAAEAAAEARYLDDLRASAKTLEADRKRPPPVEKKPSKRQKKNGGRGKGKPR